MSPRTLLAAGLIAALAAGSAPAAAKPSPKVKQARLERRAAPKGPLSHAGRWITDANGRVVILHGLNMVYKRPPYYPAAAGFGADDAAFLHRNGFNTIRLGVIHKGVEPNPGSYDNAYVAQIAATESELAKQGIFSLVDFHQDLLNERFGGEGEPDWAVLDESQPSAPSGFPGTYQTSPGLNRAFDNFWANAPGPGGAGIQDRYGAAWAQVAAAFASRPDVLGYDIFNEPWPGTNYLPCISRSGCPAFDQNQLTPFYKRTIAYIRGADSTHLAFYEPLSFFNFGSQTSIGDTGDDRAGFSFHDYCLSPNPDADICKQTEELPFQNAEAQSQKTGDALLLSEFGATTDLTSLGRIENLADAHMVSWQEWHYCACDDPTTSGPGNVQALVIDPSQPPTGANVETDKLRTLVRPYPQAIAGTPSSYSFEETSRRFSLSVDKITPTGSGRVKRGLTDVYVPRLLYPKGYSVEARGAKVLSKHGAQQLILQGFPKAHTISVVVKPR